MHIIHVILHWLAVHTGTIDESSSYYGFWSGFGSDIGEFAIIVGLYGLLRKHNCHVRGCWRMGRHPVGGTPYITCRRHHPTGAPTHEDIRALAGGNTVAGNIVTSIVSWLTTRNGSAPSAAEQAQAMDFLSQMTAESAAHGDKISAALSRLPGAAGMTFTTTVEVISCGNKRAVLYSSELADNAGTAPIRIVDRQLLNVVPGS